MINEIETCRQCRHQTGDFHCSSEHTRDKDGSMLLSRHAWHVTRPGESCSGKYFEPKAEAAGGADAIRAARDQLADAEKLPCICTGFVIQYEGRCQCAKGKAVGEAKALLAAALAAL